MKYEDYFNQWWADVTLIPLFRFVHSALFQFLIRATTTNNLLLLSLHPKGLLKHGAWSLGGSPFLWEMQGRDIWIREGKILGLKEMLACAVTPWISGPHWKATLLLFSRYTNHAIMEFQITYDTRSLKARGVEERNRHGYRNDTHK